MSQRDGWAGIRLAGDILPASGNEQSAHLSASWSACPHMRLAARNRSFCGDFNACYQNPVHL